MPGPGGVPGPGGRVGIPGCTEADPPGEMATASDGTHPTGMHSCYFKMLGCLFLPIPGRGTAHLQF